MTNDAPALALQKPDGSQLTRIEAEKELWDKCKTSHTMRRLAWGQFGLDNRFAWMLKPASVTHWVLDEMIRKRMIAGDPIGVQPELESDDSYFNSFIQRLKVFVEDGRALPPKEGEGIDMSDFQQPPNGQMPGYAPPPPPPIGFPGQQQGMQQPPPPQQYAAPPPPQQYGAPQPGQGFPQQQAPQFGNPGQQAPQQFGAPPQAPSFPPQGMPMPPQQMMPPPQQAGAPPAPPAQTPSNRRRAAKDAGAAPQHNGVLPGQTALPFGGNGAAPPMMPQFGGQGMQQAPQLAQMPGPAQGGSTVEALQAQISELKGIVATMAQQLAETLHRVRGIDGATSIGIRGYYSLNLPNQPSQLSTEATFKEASLPYPS